MHTKLSCFFRFPWTFFPCTVLDIPFVYNVSLPVFCWKSFSFRWRCLPRREDLHRGFPPIQKTIGPPTRTTSFSLSFLLALHPPPKPSSINYFLPSRKTRFRLYASSSPSRHRLPTKLFSGVVHKYPAPVPVALTVLLIPFPLVEAAGTPVVTFYFDQLFSF